MTKDSSAKRKAGKRKPEKLSFTQDFIPIKNLEHGIIETTDGRYIKILEIEPINFMLRSEEEQYEIICSFASWLKISPVHLQFKSITRKADSDKHIAMLRKEKRCLLGWWEQLISASAHTPFITRAAL